MSDFNDEQFTPMDQDKEARLMRQGKELFIKELHKQLEQLQTLLDHNQVRPVYEELKQLYRIVHTLKGSAPIFGYLRIGKLAEELVLAWEWTQSLDESDLDAKLSAVPLQESLLLSMHTIRQMVMEYDIGITDLDKSMAIMLSSLQCKLLIIDDDDTLRTYLQRRLQLDGCTVDDAPDVETAKRMLHEQNYDLIMLELIMYPEPGYELFEYLKEDPTLKWIPLIVLSGRNDLNDKVRCFQMGADDYVAKPYQYKELAARIYSLLKRTRNFEQLAFRDPLTGAFNRRYFDLQIGLELQRIERYPVPISLAFIDLDKFKSINDGYGHHVGDLVLQGLAHMLQTNLRTTDLMARFGGEEFVVVLPNSSETQAIRSIQAILDQVGKQPVAQNEGQAFSITFSAGVAQWQPGMSIGEWLRMADGAMYQAKQQGRNRVLGVQDSNSLLVGSHEEYMPPVNEKKRLLLVDDDSILRSIIVSYLEHLPIDIVQASDGQEALQILRKEQFDVCIFDGLMPNMEGFSLIAMVKSDEHLSKRDMKIIMLSGKKKEDDAARGLQLGADDHMTKPFSPVELEMRVRRILKL
jgi:two-component system cell cycle response regulator